MIIAPPHMDITLTFLTFDLENDPLLVGEGDCKYDWLDVWDGLPQGERKDTENVFILHEQSLKGLKARIKSGFVTDFEYNRNSIKFGHYVQLN